jgi:hypothetical protein
VSRLRPKAEMYGYNPPKRPELHDVHVMVCESELMGYQRRYPKLTRQQILGVMIEAGPGRRAVEAALDRLAAPVLVARSS